MNYKTRRFPLVNSFANVSKSIENCKTADVFTFTRENLNEKFDFFCAVNIFMESPTELLEITEENKFFSNCQLTFCAALENLHVRKPRIPL